MDWGRAVRIAIVAESVLPEQGGAETSTLQFVRHLLHRGLMVDLYTRSLLPDEPGLQVHSVDTANATHGTRTLRFVRAADRMLGSRAADVIHAITPCRRAQVYQPRGGTIPETIARSLALRQTPAGRLLKALTNRLNLKQWRMLAMERALLHRQPPPTVVAISQYVARQFQEHYGLDAAGIRVVFNGVDHQPPDPETHRRERSACRRLYAVEDSGVLALLVAHNFRLKGVASWIRAMAILRQRLGARIRSVIVGKGNPLPYRKTLAALGLQDQVLFAGPTRHTQLFYHGADLLVHPTYYDPCSRVVLEAMLHGVPCVTTRFNGAAEIIEHGRTGMVIDHPGDAVALAEACLRVIHGQFAGALHQTLPRLRTQLSMQHHADQLIDIYRHLATHPAPPEGARGRP